MGTSKLSGKPDKMLGGYLRWICIPSRRSSNTPSRFHATETRIISGSFVRQACDLTFFIIIKACQGQVVNCFVINSIMS